MGKIESTILTILAFFIKLLGKNKLLIVNYHRIHNTHDLFFDDDIDQAYFSWQIRLMSQYLSPVLLNDGLIKLTTGQLPGGSIVVTFDDGYRDNFIDAFPILKQYNVPATFYIASDFLNGGIMWNDVIIESIKLTSKKTLDLSKLGFKQYSLSSKEEKIIAIEDIIKQVKYKQLHDRLQIVTELNQICEVDLPDKLMMDDEHVIQLHQQGIEIGGHTSHHPILSSEDDKVVIEELLAGKYYLETLLNTELSSFAYPNGKLNKDYKEKHAVMVKSAGFKSAVTTNWGINTRTTEYFQLYRFTPWDKSPILFLLRLLKLSVFNRV